MEKKADLSHVLKSWPYDPENDARLVVVEDGREVLQVRLPLGIEQYELQGRPDGERPYGKESALDYHTERLAEAERTGAAANFSLSPEECSELFTEGTLYYYRYIHFFQRNDWVNTIRDTARNLRLFDFVRHYAEDPEDQLYLEQWRPYVIRMNSVALAMLKLNDGKHQQALEIVNKALANIQALDELDDENFHFERERSLKALRGLKQQIEENQPLSEVELLERDLQDAITQQQFELAADLRDRIRAMRNRPEK